MSVRVGAGWWGLAGTAIVAAACSSPFVAADADGSGGGIGEGGDASDEDGTGGGLASTGGAMMSGGAGGSGSLGSGGAGDSGGAAGGGGGSSGSGGLGSGGATMVDELGGTCSSNGALACSVSDILQRLACQGGIWADGGTCGPGEACDPAVGGSLGTCQDIVPECEGRAAGDAVCRDREAFQCGPRGVSRVAVQTCDAFCSQGACDVPPSCEGTSTLCGTASCCESPLVSGGTFGMGQSNATTATITDFRLDTFEVTVSRFRPFVAALVGGYTPPAGAGKHTHLPGGGLAVGTSIEPGWDTAWNTFLPTDVGTWNTQLACSDVDTVHSTWTGTPGDAHAEILPINCVNWYQAAAFCIWDEGFLPSEVEWEYAASGGDEEASYPWGEDAPTPTLASYECLGDGVVDCATTLSEILAVGSKAGFGFFGQADLAGGMWEWNLDYFHSALDATCDDCVRLDTDPLRVKRGGSFFSQSEFLYAFYRDNEPPDTRSDRIGVRCARAP
jgi:sulfatase modifying factor 1